jgi:exopolysaccharide production protein ExoQ
MHVVAVSAANRQAGRRESHSAATSRERRRRCVPAAKGALLLACFTSGPYISIWRWLSDVPLGTDSWPYVLTVWVPAALGAGWCVVDVVGYVRESPVGVAVRPIIVGLAGPIALLGWAAASAAWTTSPALTAREVTLAALVIASAAWFAWSLDFRQQVAALFAAMQLLTIGSLLAVIVAPSARFSTAIGDHSWIGLFGNPNLLGPVATAAVVSVVGAWRLVGRRWRGPLAALAVIDLAVAAKATSVTAWLALIASLVVIGLAVLVQWRVRRGSSRRSALNGSALVAVTTLSIAAMIPLVARVVGKDSTFSGRRVVWSFVSDSLDNRWLEGFGFGSFWNDPANQQAYIAYSRLDWVASSHSTFVDTLVWLGVIGLGILIVVVLVGLGRLWWFATTRGGWESTWWCGVGAFALVENVAESMWLLQSTFWVLLLASGFVAVRLWAGLPPLGDRPVRSAGASAGPSDGRAGGRR